MFLLKKNHNTSRRRSSLKSFTLIELLVVVAIIVTVLTAIIIMTSGARQRARDAQRIANLNQIFNAIELYRSDNNGRPPGEDNVEYKNGDPEWIPGLSPAYISVVPSDPIDTPPFQYHYKRQGYEAEVAARMEQPNLPQAAHDGGSGGPLFYEVGTKRDIIVTTGSGTGGGSWGGAVQSSGVSVLGIDPSSGINSETVAISSIWGTGFQPGAAVNLTQTGQEDIVGIDFNVTSPTTIIGGSINLLGLAPGGWDVVVTNPDFTGNVLVNGFSVTASPPPGQATSPQIKIISPISGAITLGTSFEIQWCNNSLVALSGSTKGFLIKGGIVFGEIFNSAVNENIPACSNDPPLNPKSFEWKRTGLFFTNAWTLSYGPQGETMAQAGNDYKIRVATTDANGNTFSDETDTLLTFQDPAGDILLISRDPSSPASGFSTAQGTGNITFLAIKLNAPIAKSSTIYKLSFQDILYGGVYDNGTIASNNTDLKSFSLWDGATQIGSTVAASDSQGIVFSGLSLVIPANTSKVFTLKANVSSQATLAAIHGINFIDLLDDTLVNLIYDQTNKFAVTPLKGGTFTITAP